MNSEPANRVFGPIGRVFDGAFAIIRGTGFVFRTRAAWPYAVLPVGVCALLCVLSSAAAFQFVPQLLAASWPGLAPGSAGFGAGVLRVLASLFAALLGVLAAVLVTPPLCAPALERLLLLRERALGLAPRPAAGLWREFSSALAAQLVAAAVGSTLLIVLWTITWLAPPLSVITFPLKLLVVALAWAWSLLDYPLSLRGVSLSERLRLMRGDAARVLGFGAGLSLVFAVPLLPLLMLPAAVAAAAEVAIGLEQTARMSRSNPPKSQLSCAS